MKSNRWAARLGVLAAGSVLILSLGVLFAQTSEDLPAASAQSSKITQPAARPFPNHLELSATFDRP